MRLFLWTFGLAVVGFWLGASVGTAFRELVPDRGIAFAIVGACIGFIIGKLVHHDTGAKAQGAPIQRLD